MIKWQSREKNRNKNKTRFLLTNVRELLAYYSPTQRWPQWWREILTMDKSKSSILGFIHCMEEEVAWIMDIHKLLCSNEWPNWLVKFLKATRLKDWENLRWKVVVMVIVVVKIHNNIYTHLLTLVPSYNLNSISLFVMLRLSAFFPLSLLLIRFPIWEPLLFIQTWRAEEDICFCGVLLWSINEFSDLRNILWICCRTQYFPNTANICMNSRCLLNC